MQHQLKAEHFQKLVTLPVARIHNDLIQGFVSKFNDKLNTLYYLPKVHIADNKNKDVIVSKEFTLQQLKSYSSEGELSQRVFPLTIDNYTPEQIFNFYVPNVQYPKNFETAGSIVLYCLSPEQHIHKKLIGQILLKRLKNIKTVANKLENVENKQQNYSIELMAGQNDFNVQIKQAKVIFKFNLQMVCWYSEEIKERERLLKLFKEGETVLDLFASVGFLSVRACSLKIPVIVNESNPDLFTFMVKNLNLNKFSRRAICFNQPVRGFIQKYKTKQFIKSLKQKFQTLHHIYLNTNSNGIKYLSAFRNFFTTSNWIHQHCPLIHVNCISIGDNDQQCKQNIINSISDALPGFTKSKIKIFHFLKQISVSKRMYCVSFQLFQTHTLPNIQ